VIFKEVFFAAQAARRAMKTTYHTITLNLVVKSYENCCTLKVLFGHMLREIFKEKKRKKLHL